MDREGTYFGTIVGAKGETAKSGNAQIVVEISLTHYHNGDRWEELPLAITRKIFWSLTPKAIPYTMERLEAVGFNGDLENPAFTYNVMDRSARPKFQASDNEYNGKKTTRWDIVGDFGANDSRGISKDVIDDFKRQWAARKGESQEEPGANNVPF